MHLSLKIRKLIKHELCLKLKQARKLGALHMKIANQVEYI